jgi:hypothetical protein
MLKIKSLINYSITDFLKQSRNDGFQFIEKFEILKEQSETVVFQFVEKFEHI